MESRVHVTAGEFLPREEPARVRIDFGNSGVMLGNVNLEELFVRLSEPCRGVPGGSLISVGGLLQEAAELPAALNEIADRHGKTIAKLRDLVGKIWYAPGMPGAVKAQRSFCGRTSGQGPARRRLNFRRRHSRCAAVWRRLQRRSHFAPGEDSESITAPRKQDGSAGR